MGMETLIEGAFWLISMCMVGYLSIFFSMKLRSMKPDSAAMPIINSLEGARLFFIFGINYFVIGIASCLLAFVADGGIWVHLDSIIQQWWLLEIFIFFNLITSYGLYTAIKRVVINV